MTHFKKIIFVFFTLVFFFAPSFIVIAEEGFNYTVEFEGVTDEETLKLLKSASQLIILQESPPATLGALRRRTEDDIGNLLKALQSKAYYDPKITFKIDNQQSPAVVQLKISVGPLYTFSSLELKTTDAEINTFPLESITPEQLDFFVGAEALPYDIIEAEEDLLEIINKNGYPLVKLNKRQVIVDQQTKTVAVILNVDSGPVAYFGSTDVTGDDRVLPSFFEKKIAWEEGERYDPKKILETTNNLEGSGLFTSMNVTYEDELLPDGSLPMHIAVIEGKHRTIAFGAGYATDLGPGVNAEWEHRNIRGLGERISVVANVWQIKQEGYVRFLKQDFLRSKQDLILKAEVEHEDTKGFDESSISLSGIIERQFTDTIRFSYGGMFTRLRNFNSSNNGEFNLFKVPMQVMWNKSNSLLDPTEGMTVHLKTTPTLQTLKKYFSYTTNILTITTYQPLDDDKKFVLAAKATFGSIVGASHNDMPPSELFYAGSDSLLRGYRYLTVSPLNRHHDPIGGRSLMVFSLEARLKVYDPFGIVFFYDVGNVYKYWCPEFNHKQRQSVGVGLRYHTPVGPIRLDFAVPLDPRKHVDRAFQAYFSIGQAF